MKKLYIVLLLNIVCAALFGQTLDEARELYKIGEYERALPVFEKEYKEKPTDPSINQWYGVCLFETGKDLKKAEESIIFAAEKKVQDAYLYLGKIYTKTYRFDLAQKEFDRYSRLKKRDKEAMAKLEEAKSYMALLKRATSHPEDIQIIDSLVVDKADFLSVYKISQSSGQLELQKNNIVAYSNEKRSKMYYAKKNSDNNKFSLFSKEKLIDDFGNEKELSSDNFGLSGNLNYPFVMADGVTIYFSAQDKDNLGGYDIYVTRYNLNNDTYLSPERLNTPFNSSFNDYMYVVDEEKGVGWFATDRFQPDGKVCIYTFIPNDKVEILESEDSQYLLDRAKITSIMLTRKPGVDYSKQIKLAQKDVVIEKEIKKDFEFVINNKYTYYTFSDFKDRTALDIYRQAVTKKKDLEDINNQLNKLRDSYRNNSSNTMAQEILRLEGQRPKLADEINELEIKARNQEIKNL